MTDSLHDLRTLLTAGRDKVKVFGAWLDADIAGRKAGQGNRAAGLIARADRGEELSNQEMAEVRTKAEYTSDLGICVMHRGSVRPPSLSCRSVTIWVTNVLQARRTAGTKYLMTMWAD